MVMFFEKIVLWDSLFHDFHIPYMMLYLNLMAVQGEGATFP